MKVSEQSPQELKELQEAAKRQHDGAGIDQPLEVIDHCLDCRDYEECTHPDKTIR